MNGVNIERMEDDCIIKKTILNYVTREKRGAGRRNSGEWNDKIISIGIGKHLKPLQSDLHSSGAR
jgi:hypothetical protein